MRYISFLKKLVSTNFSKTVFSRITIYPTYFMLHVRNVPFHITVFKDQWDEYPDKRYHLFHITHENDDKKCSSYFWIDNYLKIKNIPKNKFRYNQEDFSMFASTRGYCKDKAVKVIRINFQRLLNKM